jgi:bifunctional polynucleotide phosphatase/kinase
LPKLAFTGFASRYREPQLSEGIAEIMKIDFQVRFNMWCAI